MWLVKVKPVCVEYKSEDLKRDFASVKTTLYLGKSIRPTTKQDVKYVRSTDGSGDECVVKKGR